MDVITDMMQHTNPLFIYFIVAIVLLLESSGIPVINSTLLLFTGALASLGHLNIWYLLLASVAGSVSGACLSYAIGMHGGRRIMLYLAHLFRIDKGKVDIVESWFQRSGVWMIFFSRMLPYVRPFACFPAGIARISFSRFFICALSGSVVWCMSILAVGWYLGHRWKLAVSIIQEYTLPALVLIALLIVFYLLVTRRIKNYVHARLRSTTAKDEAKL